MSRGACRRRQALNLQLNKYEGWAGLGLARLSLQHGTLLTIKDFGALSHRSVIANAESGAGDGRPAGLGGQS